ncbi:hypothetical protein JTE90_005896 [Oedothorax gibbosus]|uniref:Uncharacterized protein n=2 Tax=cellular organisms TaxID=131567 RepID=A0AAV6TQ84_9ARAC|nr:hypothetical protein JTE90_005896 [Oedothorax gibbosus]
MINEGAAQDKSNVHRLVQEVVRINLKDENKEKDILEKAIEILNKTKKGGPKTRHQGDKPLSKSNEIHAAIVCHYASQYPDLENQVNVLFGDLHGSHILTYFAKKGNRKLLSKILQNDEVKNSQKAKNKALLQAKNYEIAEILVSHGANIDDLEITNLQNPHILRALLKADKIDQKKKNKYLFDTVFENESKLVELLMKYGADPDARAEAYLERDDDQSPILDKDDTILGAASKLPKISKKIISLLKKEKYRDSDDSQHSSESKDKTSEEEELLELSTPTECSSSQRKKRSANDICWEDADEPDKTKSHLGKVGKISHKLNSGLMIKDIGADIINGNYENVAVNLGLIGGGQVFGKAADKVLAKGVALEADKKLLGNSLKAASPFLKRGTAGFFAYDLINQIREYRDGNKDALSGIISNGIFVGMDAAEAGVEAAEFLEVIEGVSEFTGPIGEAIGASIFLEMEIDHAKKQVEEIEKHVHLTEEEELIPISTNR